MIKVTMSVSSPFRPSISRGSLLSVSIRDGLILAITAYVHDRNTRAAAIQPHAGAYIQFTDTPMHTATATPNTAVMARAVIACRNRAVSAQGAHLAECDIAQFGFARDTTT